jgi:hypothetical protein
MLDWPDTANPSRNAGRMADLQPAHEQENKQDNNDETESSTTIISSPIEGTTSDATEATEKHDYQ